MTLYFILLLFTSYFDVIYILRLILLFCTFWQFVTFLPADWIRQYYHTSWVGNKYIFYIKGKEVNWVNFNCRVYVYNVLAQCNSLPWNCLTSNNRILLPLNFSYFTRHGLKPKLRFTLLYLSLLLLLYWLSTRVPISNILCIFVNILLRMIFLYSLSYLYLCISNCRHVEPSGGCIFEPHHFY
jgi:hypothetical protein